MYLLLACKLYALPLLSLDDVNPLETFVHFVRDLFYICTGNTRLGVNSLIDIGITSMPIHVLQYAFHVE